MSACFQLVYVGGRAASGLQGEYEQVWSAPDQLGGLGLIAGRCPQSGQSGSVYLCACFVCSRKNREQREGAERGSREREQREGAIQRGPQKRSQIAER